MNYKTKSFAGLFGLACLCVALASCGRQPERYEYKIVSFIHERPDQDLDTLMLKALGGDFSDIEDVLNTHGQEGWQLVNSDKSIGIFMRRIP